MLADTVEAACRSLDKPSVPRLEKFITTLMTAKIDQKQLEDCNLTFNDITKIHDAFVQILAGYYHSRTKYPDQKDPDGPQAQQNNGENQPRTSEESVKAVEEMESKAEDKKTEDKKVEEKKTEPKKSLKEKAEKIARSSNEKEKKEKN